ncbi:hypothetical protein H9P43_005484 [Blastocladiella emersonii ATCC 22665]|nr:hypothetical protein H9P43_005484 [Blastocladiella emersonii ATCC 22665]
MSSTSRPPTSTATGTVAPQFPGASPTQCPVCPTCFTCASEGCLNFGQCVNGNCKCPDGLAGKDCGLASCNSTNVPAELRAPRPDRSECQCDDGFAGINCNTCLRDAACASTANVPPEERRDGEPRICNMTPRVFRRHHMQCEITSPEVKGVFPGLMEVSMARNLQTKSVLASIWLKKVLQFSCQVGQCTPSVAPAVLAADGSVATPPVDTWTCSSVQCKCIARTDMCGGGNSLDITQALRDLPGPFVMTCPLDPASPAGNATTIAKVSERVVNGRTVREWTGGNSCTFKLGGALDALFPNGLKMDNCLNGECAYASDAPPAIGGSSALSSWSVGEISGVSVVGALLLGLLLALFLGKRQRDSFRRVPVPPAASGMAYSVANLHYEVGDKRILSNVSATFPAGTLTAILGPSGAGKSSALDILAHKRKSGTVRAEFELDGERIAMGDKHLRHSLGFVDQEDVLLPWLTVEESLWFVANTRLPESLPHDNKRDIIDGVLRDLNIHHIRHTRIGGSGYFRGISGGERRRVSIATELVTRPALLLLDEPSSGLDSSNTRKLLETLAELAHKQNKTIVCTIHQPRSDVYALFDQVLLLARGNVLYHGPARAAAAYFARLGFPCPAQYNVADHLLDVAVDLELKPQSPGPIRASILAEAAAARGHGDDEDDDLPNSPESTVVWSVPAWDSAAAAGTGAGGDASESSIVTKIEMRERTTAASSKAAAGPAGLAAAAAGSEPRTFREGPPMSPTGSTELEHAEQQLEGMRLRTISHSSQTTTSLSGSLSGSRHRSRGSAATATYQVSYLTQITQLLARNARCLVRNPRLLIGHNALAVVLGVFLGGVYFHAPATIAGLQNRLGSVFFLESLTAFAALSALGGMAEDRLLFIRERGNASYKPSAYFVSKLLLDLIPLRIVPTVVMGSIAYFMIGFQLSLAHYAKYMAVLVLFSGISALVCMALAVLMWDVALANLVGALTTLFLSLFSGVLINANAMPNAIRWLQYVSYFRYATEALAVNEIEGLLVQDNFGGVSVNVSGSLILTSIFGYSTGSYLRDLLVLVAIHVVLLVAVGALIALRLREVR